MMSLTADRSLPRLNNQAGASPVPCSWRATGMDIGTLTEA